MMNKKRINGLFMDFLREAACQNIRLSAAIRRSCHPDEGGISG